ncbi:Mismatch repair endonuclease PMS2 [Paramyrothecium foliicola]|nr:Mismatch repair endonuclease PMS2 [Paramyrothecium foliicola]
MVLLMTARCVGIILILASAHRCSPIAKVHRIQSGQVIVDLCSVVKELVENSIDAGATIVDVRFRNQGLETIEVQDNGSGIAPANYGSVALKHHTSKLSSYSDIAVLHTFGFRGEALASLCALSNFSIVTCLASDAPKGSRLTFEPSGKLKTTSVVAAQRGTTVTVEKLFHNLPVRRRELERNIKREWTKVISLLNQYACIQKNVKFTVSQQPTKGKRIVLFSTKGNDSTRDNIINIFGAKTMTTLVPLDLKLEMQPSKVEPSMQSLLEERSGSTEVHVVGHVSRPLGGEGRQTPDRQMFFVNGRPCGLPQFARTFNEVYRSYNSSQSPFIFADIQLDTHMYDVNVSPDKRTILLHDQTRLLETLRASLVSLFDSHEYTVPVSRPLSGQSSSISNNSQASISGKHLVKGKEPEQTIQASVFVKDADAKETVTEPCDSEGEAAIRRPLRRLTSRSLRENGPDQRLITPWVERRSSVSSVASTQSSVSEHPVAISTQPGYTTHKRMPTTREHEDITKSLPVQDFNKRIAEFSAVNASTRAPQSGSSSTASTPTKEVEEFGIPTVKLTSLLPTQLQGSSQEKRGLRTGSPNLTSINIGDPPFKRHQESHPALSSRQTCGSPHHDTEHPSTPPSDETGDDSLETIDSVEQSVADSGSEAAEEAYTEFKLATQQQGVSLERNVTLTTRKPRQDKDDEEESMEEVAEVAQAAVEDLTVEPRVLSFQSGSRRKDSTLSLIQRYNIDGKLLFTRMGNWRNSILSPIWTPPELKHVEDIDAADAEAKLALIISRDDFSRMRVAGQFNLGFIIATRPAQLRQEGEAQEGDELFIIDQHASDEKYNFERLQNTTLVQSQPLVHRKRLELTALEEEVIMQNKDAIEANGFKFDIDLSGDAPVGSRCQLTALPLSRETTFDIADFEELVALLGDESSESSRIPRPSRVRKMFAMRACRSSIMIGRPLTRSQMYTLVRHMGNMDKPWNCPHGRPTMRHLCRLQAWDRKSWKGDMECNSASAWQTYGKGK